MDRRRIIALAVSAVAVGAALAVAVNVATSPWTASWARGGAWLATVTVAGAGIGLAVWQGVWHRTDARHSAANGVALLRETLVEEYALTPASAEPVLGAWGWGGDPDEWFTRSGSVLVLGAPGMGKTALLAGLAKRLAERARRDPESPVPVMLSLASWGIGGRTLETWVGEELRRRHGGQPDASQKLLRPGRSCLLLDGLDEVPLPDRAGCVDEINGFLERQPGMRTAVASRITEYQELPVRLRLNTTVTLGPPAMEDLSSGKPDLLRMIDPPEYLLEDEEAKPATGEFPPLRNGSPDDGGPSNPGGPPSPGDLPPPGAPAPSPPNKAPTPATRDARRVVLERQVLSVMDDQVSQDEVQIASAARITPGETARTLQRLAERGLVVPSRPRSTGARIVRRYLKR